MLPYHGKMICGLVPYWSKFCQAKIRIRSYLKNRILVQGSVFATLKAWLHQDKRGGAVNEAGGILEYFEDLGPTDENKNRRGIGLCVKTQR